MSKESGSQFHHENVHVVEACNILSCLSAEERIVWGLKTFGLGHTIVTTSGGETSAVLLSLLGSVHKAKGLLSPIRVIFIDTGLYGKTTYDFVEHLREQGRGVYEILVYRPEATLAEMNDVYPKWSDFDSDDSVHVRYHLKKEPLERAFRELGAKLWINGRRSDKHTSREKTPPFEVRPDGICILNPMFDWSRKKTMEHVAQHNLAVNPKHFDPFKKGQAAEDQTMECGIFLP